MVSGCFSFSHLTLSLLPFVFDVCSSICLGICVRFFAIYLQVLPFTLFFQVSHCISPSWFPSPVSRLHHRHSVLSLTCLSCSISCFSVHCFQWVHSMCVREILSWYGFLLCPCVSSPSRRLDVVHWSPVLAVLPAKWCLLLSHFSSSFSCFMPDADMLLSHWCRSSIWISRWGEGKMVKCLLLISFRHMERCVPTEFYHHTLLSSSSLHPSFAWLSIPSPELVKKSLLRVYADVRRVNLSNSRFFLVVCMKHMAWHAWYTQIDIRLSCVDCPQTDVSCLSSLWDSRLSAFCCIFFSCFFSCFESEEEREASAFFHFRWRPFFRHMPRIILSHSLSCFFDIFFLPPPSSSPAFLPAPSHSQLKIPRHLEPTSSP